MAAGGSGYETVMDATTVEETPDTASRWLATAGALPGVALGLGLGALAVVRRTKPLHPVGRVGTGELEISSPRPEYGVPLLAGPGTHRCTARFSRAAGTPASWPDIDGLAVRLEEPTADVLFASTGVGRMTRFLLAPRRPAEHGPLTTLLPVSTRSGSLLLRMSPLDRSEPPATWELAAAHAGTEWLPVGVLRVAWGGDQPLRFDPVENVLPGTGQYPLVRALREPSYLLARRGARRVRT